ncbi:M24 family metallopeptidase [Castellaniella hirudinis]|uniref:M24 family metallopeptidase n=1 Tax=Castellaniella hirudinis TaxID=1144617 RepID=UPI0039C1951B
MHLTDCREPTAPYFEPEEFAGRLATVRAKMRDLGVDTLLVSSPENIFWLTGLDHWGYFAPHLLVVPAEGELVLATRAMERVTIAHQVRNARFEGHADHETVADAALRVLRADCGTIGLEAWSSGLPHGLAQQLKHSLHARDWLDVQGLIDDLRMVKSPAEQALMRAAARVSDAGMTAAIDAVAEGASERDVAACAQQAMTAAGGTFPGFGPFIRSTRRLGEEHTTWRGDRFAAGDSVFLELTGCVARYHAPLGRLIHVGAIAPESRAMADLAATAFAAATDAMREGTRFRDVYAAWQAQVDRAGLAHYQRHHCGYLVGIGFPPSWTGGNKVTGLRRDSDVVLRAGMSFHVLSWLMGTRRGDFFVSNTVLLGPSGPEVLNRAPGGVMLR